MEKKRNIILELCSGCTYMIVSVNIVHAVGLHAAVLLAELSNANYMFADSDGEFYDSAETIKNHTGLSDWDLRNALKKLEDLGIISSRFKGMPSKKYFTIHSEQIVKVLEACETTINSQSRGVHASGNPQSRGRHASSPVAGTDEKVRINSNLKISNRIRENKNNEVESRTQVSSEMTPCCSTIEDNLIENSEDDVTATVIDYAAAGIDVSTPPYPPQTDEDDTSDFDDMFGTPIGTGRDARLARTQAAVNTPARELFDYWNSKKIRVHKAFQSNYIERFTKIIQNYSLEEIKVFIDHYEKIVHDLNYYWTYIWDLQDFIDPKEERFLKFADGGQEWVNYNLGSKSQQEFKKSEFFSGDLEKIQSGEKTISQIDAEYKEKARRLRDNPNKIIF